MKSVYLPAYVRSFSVCHHSVRLQGTGVLSDPLDGQSLTENTIGGECGLGASGNLSICLSGAVSEEQLAGLTVNMAGEGAFQIQSCGQDPFNPACPAQYTCSFTGSFLVSTCINSIEDAEGNVLSSCADQSCDNA
jgi:hypothetical protein